MEEKLTTEHYKYINTLVYAMTSPTVFSKEDREDIFQNVIVKIHSSNSVLLEDKGKVLAYLKRSVRNGIIDFYRVNSDENKILKTEDYDLRYLSEIFGFGSDLTPEDMLICPLAHKAIDVDLNLSYAINKVGKMLTKRQFTIWFNFCIGDNYEELASAHKTSTQSIANTLVKIRRKIQEELENDNEIYNGD